MKKIVLALAAITFIAGSSVYAQTNTESTTVAAPVSAGAAADASKQVLDMPAHRSRKRMLVDFGLFGCGVHVGWMKPKSALNQDVSDRHIGKPIFNVSAGTHAVGVGRN
jgi:hypothetical protein